MLLDTQRIRIAVFCRSPKIFLWEYRILEKIINSDFAEIIHFLISDESTAENKERIHPAIYNIHEKIDKYFFRKKFDYSDKIEISNAAGHIPLYKFSEYLKKPRDPSGENDEQTSIYENTDLILNFGEIPLLDKLQGAPRFGIWSYRIGDEKDYGEGTSVYWAIVRNKPEIICRVLMSGSDADNENVIYRLSVSTFTNSISINRNRAYALASLVIPRLLRGLFLSGSQFINNLKARYNDETKAFHSETSPYPKTIPAFLNLTHILRNYIHKNLFYHKEDYWFVLYKINVEDRIFPTELSSYQVLKAPGNQFWADPFAVSRNGNYYIFVEEYSPEAGKAHISVLLLDNKGDLSGSERIIERPYHMSYPFVFEFDSNYYMIPETKNNRTIQLFRCKKFPGEWEFVMNLMDNVSATDSTLFCYDKKWWLFTSIDELNHPSVPYSELYLFFTDELFSGQWTSHPMNPIVTDIKSSRPAGRIYMQDNKIFRPSQDCSGGYGTAFNLNQIIKLSVDQYEEILVSKTLPDWQKDLTGTHTFNFDKNIIVIDASAHKKRFKYPNN